MGSGAVAMSLPFSCILGLLASMTATTMGMPSCTFRQHFVLEFCLCHYTDSSKFVISEKKSCLGLCNCAVWSGGSRWTSFLLIGKKSFLQTWL